MTPKAKKAHVWPKDPLHWYVEPEDCTAALLRVERFTTACWDPACGGGNTVRQLRKAGYDAVGTDLVDRTGGAPWFMGLHDFRQASWWTPWGDDSCSVICNPPYYGGKGTEEFIARLLATPSVAKFALYTEARFLGGGDRQADLWDRTPPTRIWWLTPRPSCPPGTYLAEGNKAGGGQPDFVWLVWDKLSPPRERPDFGWLRRPKLDE